MRMLLIMFRDSLEDEIHQLLKHEDVKAYTVIPSVQGMGEAGQAFGALTSAGMNSMIFIALPQKRAVHLAEAFAKIRDQMAEHQHGAKIPMRLFMLPCEQMI